MGNFFHFGENYSSTGIYVPFGYLEREDNGAVSAGLSFGASTPHVGPYTETGIYAEHTWEPDGSQSNGHGTYAEAGLFYGDEVGAYTCGGKCWDSRDGKSFGSFNKMPLPKLPIINQSRNNNISDIARKVYRGEYGNGAERRRRLEKEGYNYREVQNYVNKKYYK